MKSVEKNIINIFLVKKNFPIMTVTASQSSCVKIITKFSEIGTSFIIISPGFYKTRLITISALKAPLVDISN